MGGTNHVLASAVIRPRCTWQCVLLVFGVLRCSSQSHRVSPLQELIAYTRGCLDALRITHGATHTEAGGVGFGLWDFLLARFPVLKSGSHPEFTSFS